MKDRIRKRTYASPQEDEVYRIDDNGETVNGHYNDDGYFIVDVHMRNVPGRTDKDGFMMDKNGKRIADDVIRDRLRVRAQMHPRDDEYEATDPRGEKIKGKYTNRGFFLVDERYRKSQARFGGQGSCCDEEGYLLDADGNRVCNREIAERKKQRRYVAKQRFMKP